MFPFPLCAHMLEGGSIHEWGGTLISNLAPTLLMAATMRTRLRSLVRVEVGQF